MRSALIIGATGEIGRRLSDELERSGCEVTAVTRDGRSGTLSFRQMLDSDPAEHTLIIDCSTGSLNQYLQFCKWLARSPSAQLLHFSSVRAVTGGEGDMYANYKRSVLRILEPLGERLIVIPGDLFSYDNRLVGYWQFVTDVDTWRFVSARPLQVIDIKSLAQQITNLANEQVTALETHGMKLRSLSAGRDLPVRITSARTCNLLFRLRLNAVLRKFRVSVVL